MLIYEWYNIRAYVDFLYSSINIQHVMYGLIGFADYQLLGRQCPEKPEIRIALNPPDIDSCHRFLPYFSGSTDDLMCI